MVLTVFGGRFCRDWIPQGGAQWRVVFLLRNCLGKFQCFEKPHLNPWTIHGTNGIFTYMNGWIFMVNGWVNIPVPWSIWIMFFFCFEMCFSVVFPTAFGFQKIIPEAKSFASTKKVFLGNICPKRKQGREMFGNVSPYFFAAQTKSFFDFAEEMRIWCICAVDQSMN